MSDSSNRIREDNRPDVIWTTENPTYLSVELYSGNCCLRATLADCVHYPVPGDGLRLVQIPDASGPARNLDAPLIAARVARASTIPAQFCTSTKASLHHSRCSAVRLERERQRTLVYVKHRIFVLYAEIARICRIFADSVRPMDDGVSRILIIVLLSW